MKQNDKTYKISTINGYTEREDREKNFRDSDVYEIPFNELNLIRHNLSSNFKKEIKKLMSNLTQVDDEFIKQVILMMSGSIEESQDEDLIKAISNVVKDILKGSSDDVILDYLKSFYFGGNNG